MIRLEKLTCTKTYMYPDKSVATPERMASEYPAYEFVTHVVTTDDDRQICYAVDALSTLKEIHKIDGALSEEEAIAALEAKLNEPQPEPEPTAEERIAAAMEFQNLMMLEDVE